ncbi:MAG: hypothetical protein ABI680_03115 [Chthoniobacteraceae bacterium]
MVRGLDLFRDRFREFEGSFILIGGAACDEWFNAEGLEFRATKDLDLVLIIETLTPAIVRALRIFISEGGYNIQERTAGTPVLYRFAKPQNGSFPFMLELFSRRPEGLELDDGQTIVPLPAGAEQHSLSAILLDEDYYELIQSHAVVRNGLSMANAIALVPLKVRAWLDLAERKDRGESVDAKDIAKHRNDVFRLAGTLPGEPGPELPDRITDDLSRFLNAFPEDAPEWPAILASLKTTFGGGLAPAALRGALQTFFRLPA